MLGRKSRDQESVGTTTSTPGGASSSTSVISREMTVRGDCVVEGRLRIEGQVHGSVRAGGLELARTGSVHGDLMALEGAGEDPFTIAGTVDGEVRAPRVEVGPTGSILKGVQADEAHVRGSVEGGIVARRRLVLEETAVVEGDVRARTLALKEGGQVNGTIVMGEQATREETGSQGDAPDRGPQGSDEPGGDASAGADEDDPSAGAEPLRKASA